MRLYFGAILLTGMLCAPALMPAQERDRTTTTTTTRYYDPVHKDYHEWNDGERRAWEHYLRDERHAEMRDYAHASKAEQRDYWKWRHEHMDWH